MAVYTYHARTKEGRALKGLVEAPHSSEASRLLHEKELFVISLIEKKQDIITETLSAKFRRVGFADIVNFTRQLSTMIVAGLSLPESLTILRNQTTNPVFARVLLDVEQKILGGGNLADSLVNIRSISPQYILHLSVQVNLQEIWIKYSCGLQKHSKLNGNSALR